MTDHHWRLQLASSPAQLTCSAWWINGTLGPEYSKVQHSTPQQGTAQHSAVQCSAKENLPREYFIQYQSYCYGNDKDNENEYNNQFYWPLLVFLSLEQKMEGMYVFMLCLVLKEHTYVLPHAYLLQLLPTFGHPHSRMLNVVIDAV